MKNTFRMLLAIGLIASLVSVVASTGLAAKTVKAPMRIGAGPGAIAIDTSQVDVKIIGTSPSANTVTLQLPNGKIQTYKVGKDVRNLAQLKKGDTIKATVIDAIAVYLQKTGARPSATETQTVTLAPRGTKPEMIVSNTIRITGKVQLVDTRNRAVTMTGPSYKSKTFKVGSNVDLSGLKAGDNIVVRYTEAVALSLQKPMK